MERFLEVTKRLGFDTRQMDRSNKMFLMAEFKKSNRKPERGVDFEAKVRIYVACVRQRVAARLVLSLITFGAM